MRFLEVAVLFTLTVPVQLSRGSERSAIRTLFLPLVYYGPGLSGSALWFEVEEMGCGKRPHDQRVDLP